MKDVITGISVGIITAIVSVAATYWITYERIERPKIAIEALKQAQSLIPTASSKCSSQKIDNWSWRVDCTTKSACTYPINVRLDDVTIRLSGDRMDRDYKEGKDFKIQCTKRSYTATPYSEGDQWFYIEFDKNTFRHGIQRDDLIMTASVKFSALKSTTEALIKAFPEVATVVNDLSEYGQRNIVPLPGNLPSP